LVAAPKLPAPFPSNMETLFEPKLATARSWLPSPLNSPTAIEKGVLPTAKLVAVPKLPVPEPR